MKKATSSNVYLVTIISITIILLSGIFAWVYTNERNLRQERELQEKQLNQEKELKKFEQEQINSRTDLRESNNTQGVKSDNCGSVLYGCSNP